MKQVTDRHERGTATLAGKRVHHVINGLGPGGAERSLAELLPFFLEAGLRVTVVCLKHRDIGVEQDIRSLGCEVRFLPPGRWWVRARRLRRMWREEGVDLVHTTLFDANMIGRAAAAGAAVPVLTSLVNTGYDEAHFRNPDVSRLRLRAVQGIDALSSRFLTEHFHAITHAVKASAVQTLRLPADRITVIERGRDRGRLGVPSAVRRLEVRRRLALDPAAEIILNVGRQEYQKGQIYLLEAVAPLLLARPRLVLCIAGRPGHATAELEAAMQCLGLEGRVRLLGHRTDVSDLLAAADLFAFPSLYEGLGGAVLEAMAMGVPVVASRLPALEEVVEDGGSGVLVEPACAPALTAALQRLLDDPAERGRLGARGSVVFEERFGIERSAARMLDLYGRLMAGLGHGGAQMGAAPRAGARSARDSAAQERFQC